MNKKLSAFICATLFLLLPVSTLFIDASPSIAAHRVKKNGSFKGNRDQHQSGPQKGLREKKRQGKGWLGRGMAGKKRLGSPARRHSKVWPAQKRSKRK
jgi:hypothetical protein